MKYIAIIISIVCVLSSCSSIEATRESDGTILIAQRGSALKIFPQDMRISGAVDGAITPASKLKVKRTILIKGRHTADVSCEGYVDLSKPDWIEVRLVRLLHSGQAHQMFANGQHRLQKKLTEQVAASDR